MKNRQRFIASLIVALVLGTAWAVRGKFGHEQGAAWAGAIGAMAMILVAKRADWYHKIFKIALAAAFGWGLGGMISYGVVVGYGRGVDFVNVYYGLLMLFVIGILYGFLGGGLFGLALVDSKETRIKWHQLIMEMVAWGILTYALLINQLEWLMTPPRSELWAACLAASIALAWFIVRKKQYAVLKVAIWSALGAGFGFAFGNFLQVMGSVLKIHFNFWNVMEYTIGFFGGLGMAHGTLTSHWPVSEHKPGKYSNLLPMILLLVFIPFVVWDQSFVVDRFRSVLENGGTEYTIFMMQLLAIGAIFIMAIVVMHNEYIGIKEPWASGTFNCVRTIFIWYLGTYTFLSFLVTGLFTHPLEQYLYIINIAIVLMMLPRIKESFEAKELSLKISLVAFVLSVLTIALLAVVLIVSHPALPGSQVRFAR